jgi:hypothetical protein
MSRESLQKWLPAATAVEPVRTSFTPPVRVLLGEAVDTARFVHAYWEPVLDPAGKLLRPGLSQAGSKLPPNIGTELLDLQDALQTAQTDYLLTVAPTQQDVRARAEYVLSEIAAALEWWLDDGIEDDRDRQLAAIKSEYADGSNSTDTIAAELADTVALARQEVEGLKGLGGFDPALLDEAERLSKLLRERPTTPMPAENTRRALDIRNRIATLVVNKMYLIRAAARFIFRNHPEIARGAGSSYLRRHRSAARKSAKSQSAVESGNTTNNTVTK